MGLAVIGATDPGLGGPGRGVRVPPVSAVASEERRPLFGFADRLFVELLLRRAAGAAAAALWREPRGAA